MNVYLAGAKNPEARRQIAVQRAVNAHCNVVGFIDNDSAKHGTGFIGLPIIGGLSIVPEILERDLDAEEPLLESGDLPGIM